MDAGQYRARSGTEIIDAAFQILRSQFAPLFTLGVIGAIPVALFQLMRATTPADSIPMVTRIAGSAIVVVLVSAIVGGALIQAIADIYEGRQADIASALKAGVTHVGRMLVTGLIGWFVIAIGFVLLVVPGFVALAWFYAAPVVIMLEGLHQSPIKALERSRMLCRDHKRRVFGFFAVIFILYFVLSILAIVIGAMTGSKVLTILAGAATSAVLWPLHPALMTLNYYDMRIRKEGYDVELLAAR